MLDFGAVNWAQLRKYDIFQQMLNAAAHSPTAQASIPWHMTHMVLQLFLQNTCCNAQVINCDWETLNACPRLY